MRRFLALFLVSVFSALPLYLASLDGTKVQVPACCRRTGSHKCSMGAAVAAPEGAQSVGAKCPFSALTRPEAVITASLVTAPPQISTGLLTSWAAVSQYATTSLKSHSERSHQKRGPPSLLV